VIGVGYAIRQVKKATGAAESARAATEQTRISIQRTLTVNEIQKAIGRLNDLKRSAHDNDWKLAFHQCQIIRELLPDIAVRHPDVDERERTTLMDSATQITGIEDRMHRGITTGRTPSKAETFNATLSAIQEILEKMASSNTLGGR